MLPGFSSLCEVDRQVYLAYLESYNVAISVVADGLARGSSGGEVIRDITKRCGYPLIGVDVVDGKEHRYCLDIVGNGTSAGSDICVGDGQVRLAVGHGVDDRTDRVGHRCSDDSGTGGCSGDSSDDSSSGIFCSPKDRNDNSGVASEFGFGNGALRKSGLLLGSARTGELGAKGFPVGSGGKPGLTKTELNRISRQKAKNRKARKKARQASAAMSSVDWNADRVSGRDRQVVIEEKKKKYQGYFGSCDDDVRNKLVETRARRLTVENELRVAEMEQKMSVMRLQKESRLIERQFENDRMKLEIEAHKKIEQMPKGVVETVISSGTVSPNSSISLAAENKLRKDLAVATEKIAKLTGGRDSGIGDSVLSSTERDLRLANFELESIRLKDRAYSDYTFTDSDYKLSLQALREEYADVLLTNENRIAREAVGRVLDAFVGKVDEDMLEKVVELGYIDGDTLID